ncbi:hypothetical protein NC653_039230 [Populus alba x Populus x berolinensis]|nr:hypothetical protein NC653_039230 [Populus alba x Populus x berolinensis]
MRSEDQLVTKEGITCSLNDSFKKFIYWIDESSSKNSRFIWLLRLRRNNQIEFMNLPKSGGNVQEIKSYINDRSFEGPENAMRCSEMVEVVE